MLAQDWQLVVCFRARGARRSHEESPPRGRHARLAGRDGTGVLLGIRFAEMVRGSLIKLKVRKLSIRVLMVSSFPNPVDVFVIGGGPGGLATAIAARRHGLSVVLADGAVPPIDKPCGEGLMPEGVEALNQLGITIPDGEAYPFRGIRFVSDGAKAEAAFPRGTAYGIRRTDLHRVMLDHAAACGVHMLWQVAVTGLHPEGALVAGELVRALWVVGADGTNSRVRSWAKLDPREMD